jgi:hypothetical protein
MYSIYCIGDETKETYPEKTTGKNANGRRTTSIFE